MTDKKPLINPVVVLRKEFDDWAVLFNPDTAEAVGINPVGVTIWEMLARDLEFTDIIATVKQQYAEVPGEMEAEIDAFIKELAQRGFIGYQVEENS